jgi:hypothetical protein
LKGKNFWGLHSVFYYYGVDHLLVNMYQYIKDGIDNNEYIYLNLEESSFNLLINYFTEDEKKHIGIFTASVLINLYKSGREITVKKALKKFEKNVFDHGYTGARFICQLSHVLKEISKADFIEFEKPLSKIINGLNISMMCLYDMYDYINNKTIIDDELMAMSKEVFNYRLYQMKLCKIF